ncbi:uncharacterized protein LOC112195386 isoform X3 [Rosa chinensis]|uniref:uncharacterized protein LOC112195386 isoform X3 n=1 Tax=Rosa chinensis TaxID=74649 RepID=UPI001AD8BEA9|nr:uncharacterized protein LOC112195386 isoform X3 [Rosa chinensis]
MCMSLGPPSSSRCTSSRSSLVIRTSTTTASSPSPSPSLTNRSRFGTSNPLELRFRCSTPQLPRQKSQILTLPAKLDDVVLVQLVGVLVIASIQVLGTGDGFDSYSSGLRSMTDHLGKRMKRCWCCIWIWSKSSADGSFTVTSRPKAKATCPSNPPAPDFPLID